MWSKVRMIKLFLDTTTAKKAKVTITKNSELVCENENESPLLSIEESLKKTSLKLEDIDEFAANPGPGSYTGIRIGIAVAAALNFALGKELKTIEPIYS